MSLFHSPRDIRVTTAEKRKQGEDLQELFSCYWCSDAYESETELHMHRKSKHRIALAKLLKNELVCQICVQKGDSHEDLVEHLKTQHLFSSADADHVEREIFICNVCNLIYFNKQMLSVHIQYSHDPLNKYKAAAECPKCGKIVQIKHVWFHFQRHLIQSVASCPICFMKCKDQRELYLHTKEHANYLHCNFCGYDTKTKDFFTGHVKTHKRKNITGVDESSVSSAVSRCFMPNPMYRKYDCNFGIRGLRLPSFVEICILCRALCAPEEKADHVLQYHTEEPVYEKTRYICVCGEVFFNNVLLKHHIFKLKGHHRRVEIKKDKST